MAVPLVYNISELNPHTDCFALTKKARESGAIFSSCDKTSRRSPHSPARHGGRRDRARRSRAPRIEDGPTTNLAGVSRSLPVVASDTSAPRRDRGETRFAKIISPLTSTAAPFTARDFDRRLGSGRKDTRERASSEKAGAPVLFSWRGTRRGSV